VAAHRWRKWTGQKQIVALAVLAVLALIPTTAYAAPVGYTTTRSQIFVPEPPTGGDDQARRVVVDGVGNPYVAGTFSGILDLGGGPTCRLTASSSLVFVASFTAAGACRWARSIGSGFGGKDDIAGVAVTPAGNLVAFGTSIGTVHVSTLGSDVLLPGNGGADDWLVQFGGADGHYLWGQMIGGRGGESVGDLALDGFGNIYVVGTFGQTATFGTGAAAKTITSAGYSDGFAASYAPNGTLRWVIDSAAGPSDSMNLGVAISGGAAFIVGSFRGQAKVGEQVLQSGSGVTDDYVARLRTSDGLVMWVRLIRGTLGAGPSGQNGAPFVLDVAGTTSGAIVVVGAFSYGIGFATPGWPAIQPMTSPGTDALVVRYAADGTFRWARQGGTGNGAALHATAGPSDTVLVAGRFTQSLSLDGTLLESRGAYDGWVAQWNAFGGVSRATSFGSAGFDTAYDAAGLPNTPVVVGSYENTMTLPGGGTLANPNAGRDAGFALTLAPS
jgi:hypothetical protein